MIHLLNVRLLILFWTLRYLFDFNIKGHCTFQFTGCFCETLVHQNMPQTTNTTTRITKETKTTAAETTTRISTTSTTTTIITTTTTTTTFVTTTTTTTTTTITTTNSILPLGIIPCPSNFDSPCKNGGGCFISLPSDYFCQCLIGYAGRFCENLIIPNQF
jgi:hypothetical protein